MDSFPMLFINVCFVSALIAITKRLGSGQMSDNKLELEFDEAMMGIYESALSEAEYNATRFLTMLHEHRGLGTAHLLLHASKPSEGYTALYLKKRLDLTVEALIHDNPKWHALFSPEDLAICERRLRDYGYLD